MLFVGFLLIRMLGQGSLSMLSQNTLAYWFNRKLGTMNAIRSQGMTLATAIIPTINFYLIGYFGWEHAFVILGLGVWALMLPCLAFLFRNKPEDIGQYPDGERISKKDYEARRQVLAFNEPDYTLSEAMRTRSYWIMLASLALWAMMMTGLIFHGVALFDAHGLDEEYTALMTFAMSFPLVISQLGGGALADKISMNYLLSISMALFALSFGIFIFTYSAAMVVLFAVMLGVSQGLLTSLAGPYWVRYYGRLHLGKIQGSVTTVIVAASSLGSSVVGLCLDYFKNDMLVMILFVCLPLPLVFFGLLATKPPLPERESAG
jgi:MFS family permease